MVRDGRLADVAAGREVAGADLGLGRELADDGQAGRIGQRGQEPDVGIERDRSSVRAMMAQHIDEIRY